MREADHEALGLQTAFDRGGQPSFVLYDKHAHEYSVA
jgi:hypothetical protein